MSHTFEPQSDAGTCAGCEHSGFVHEDGGDRACLYSGCECRRYAHSRVPIALVGRPAGRARPRPRHTTAAGDDRVRLVARKRNSMISLELLRRDATREADTLARAGWMVVIASAVVGPTPDRRSVS